MDFWSRLIGGAGARTSPKKQSNPNSSQHRLNHFKATYNSLLQIWHNGDGVSTDAFTAENARLCLHQAAELLNGDTRGPTPHLCVAFAATSRLLVIVLRIASAFLNDGITREALGICSLLIDSEEEAFLEDRGFAVVLPQFVRSITRTVPGTEDADTESALLEVLFGIASRIRLQPELLPVWFRPRSIDGDSGTDDESITDSQNRGRNEDFPLFYLLLYYVPAEGRAGEFARMGLLYLIESATHSQRLEKWIVEGDMATLMASGLGALYSQLSRKLALSYTKDENPPILAFSKHFQLQPSSDVEDTTSDDYQTHLATFLSSLVFWQDLLEHCSSVDINQTLLDHFQFLFLQQLLYPSLLESSDVDGGSSVAVLTYLRHVLESIDHPDLVRLTLQYLFGVHSTQPELDISPKPIAMARRRKSENLVHQLASGDEKPSPDLFNLADMIVASLGSKSQQTLSATLRLLSILLRRQHPRTQLALLKTRAVAEEDKIRTFGGHEKEIDLLLSLAEDLSGFQTVEESYGRYLLDNRDILETHPCSMELLRVPAVAEENTTMAKPDSTQPEMKPHVLLTEDTVLKALLGLMDDFFVNDIETNLGLTQAIIDLSSCSLDRRPAGNDADTAIFPTTSELLSPEQALLQNVRMARREPSWNADDVSPVFAALSKLVRQVESFRRSISDFDTNLLECRITIEADENADTGSGKPENSLKRPHESQGTSPTRFLSSAQMGSISERLRHERMSGSESRTSSPRGRQLDPASTPTLVGRLNHLHISPSRSSSQNSSREYSPSPLRSKSMASTPPKPNRAFRPLAVAMQRRVKVASRRGPIHDHVREPSSSEASSVRSESTEPETGSEASSEVTLGHLLTNVIILQEFILELAALVDVRASLFEEVEFC